MITKTRRYGKGSEGVGLMSVKCQFGVGLVSVQKLAKKANIRKNCGEAQSRDTSDSPQAQKKLEKPNKLHPNLNIITHFECTDTGDLVRGNDRGRKMISSRVSEK